MEHNSSKSWELVKTYKECYLIKRSHAKDDDDDDDDLYLQRCILYLRVFV
jgi:hypothetical protein